MKLSSRLFVTVRDRTGIVFADHALAVSSLNDKGPFDVLEDHTHFISIIKDSLTIHHTDGTKRTLPITRGIMKVRDNTVQVHLGVLSELLHEDEKQH